MFLVWLGTAGVRWMWNRNDKDAVEHRDRERNAKEEIEYYQMKAFQAQQQQQQQQQHVIVREVHGGDGLGIAPAAEQGTQFPSVAIPRSYG